MRKRLLSILLAVCMMLTLAPAAFAVDADTANPTMDETTFRNAVAAGGTVTMTGDVTLTTPLTISNAVTIRGSSSHYSINFNVENAAALTIDTNSAVSIQNVTLNATASGGRGIDLTSSAPHISLANSTLNVHTRGISFKQSGDATNAVVTLNRSHILNSQITSENYSEETTIGDTRGISLFDTKDCQITITNQSSIKGFGYSINLTGTRDSTNTVPLDGTTVTVNNSDIFGWTAFNVWSSETLFNISGSHLRGINPSYGSWDSFATIVVNDDIYNTNDQLHADACIFNITDTTIDNFIPAEKLKDQIEAGAITMEFLFRIDNQGVTKAKMDGVTFKDNTDVLPCAFVAGNYNYTQEFYDYVMGLNGTETHTAEFNWVTLPTSTYSDGTTELPLVIVLS